MSTRKKISKTIEVSCNLKLHQFNDGSFEIFFRGSPGGYYYVFSENHKLLHRVQKSAYGIGKPDTNEKNNWGTLIKWLRQENEKQELPSLLKKFLVWKFEPRTKNHFIEEKLGCIIYFKEDTT
ncbi:MAG: hypothetical protein HOB32_11825 [Nitrospina sp.]|jgi:hypothetical protein|nr:hypothetical protein [Nitrospina sp.]